MPTTLEAVAVLLLAIVPGFIATTTWSRARTWRGPGNDVHTVLESLALSVVVQVVAAPLTIWWIWRTPCVSRSGRGSGRRTFSSKWAWPTKTGRDPLASVRDQR